MGLQDQWTFLKEDTVIATPVKLFFLLAPSLDPVGLESSYSLWKQHISFILLNESVGSMPLRGFTGHLASLQASFTTLKVPTPLFWQPMSVSVGFVTLSGSSLCLARQLCLILFQSFQCLTIHQNFKGRNHQQCCINRHMLEVLSEGRPTFYDFWASVLKISTVCCVVCCFGSTKNYFTSQALQYWNTMSWTSKMFKKVFHMDIINLVRTWNCMCIHKRICWILYWQTLLYSANLGVN